MLLNLWIALRAGVAITLAAVVGIPDAARRLGLVAGVTTSVVFASAAVGVFAAVVAMLAVLYLGSAAFAAVEARASR